MGTTFLQYRPRVSRPEAKDAVAVGSILFARIAVIPLFGRGPEGMVVQPAHIK
jgi:hypothetical protein